MIIEKNDYEISHRWEQAGLGRAPYAFLGVSEKTYQACPGAPVQAGGTCDYCGMGIRYQATWRSSDGKVFVTGLDCAMKSGDHGVIKIAKSERAKLQQRQRRAAYNRKIEKEKARIATATKLLKDEKIIVSLTKQPHPKKGAFFAEKTLLDWVEWMLDNAGHTGRIKATRVIEKTI